MSHYKPYPAYKDSSVEWIGEVPEHWGATRLKRISDVRLSNVDKHTVEGQQAIKLCNYVDVYKNNRITSKIDFMVASASDEQITRLTLAKGDVIITKDSETPSDIGVPALVDEGISDLVCGYHLALIRPTSSLGQYLSYLFQSHFVRAVFEIEATGMTRYALGKYSIENLSFTAPTVDEQSAIASFLDRETAKIDTLISKQEKLIELLKEKRQAVISHAVTKGLNPKAKMKDSGVEWLGEVPEHWGAGRLRYICQCLDGQRIPLNAAQRFDRLGDIPYWGANSIVDYVDESLFDEDLVLLGEDGAPFFEPSKPVAFFSQGKVWPNNHVHVLRPVIRGTGKFIAHVLNVTDYAHFIDGSTRDKLTQGSMKDIPIPQPPLPEQSAITAFLDRETAKIDTLISKSEKAIELQKEHRTALISASVTGKIDVRGAT